MVRATHAHPLFLLHLVPDELARQGVSVVVLEARVIAGGQTGRDPGMLRMRKKREGSMVKGRYERSMDNPTPYRSCHTLEQ